MDRRTVLRGVGATATATFAGVGTAGSVEGSDTDASAIPDGMIGGEFGGGRDRVFVDMARTAARFGKPDSSADPTFDGNGNASRINPE